MTTISKSRKTIGAPTFAGLFKRFLAKVVEADHTYREMDKLHNAPRERLDDMGIHKFR